jgi:hypothetical protein
VTSTSHPAGDLARRLLSREASGSDDPVDRVAAGERIFAGVRGDLAFWFGADGLEALLRRAIDRAGVAQPPSIEPRHPTRGPSAVDVIVTMARAAPPQQGAERLEMILTAFVGLLTRLVGEEMTARLLEQSQSREHRPKHQRSLS